MAFYRNVLLKRVFSLKIDKTLEAECHTRVQIQFALHWVKPRTSKMLEKNQSDVSQIHPSKRKKTYCGLKSVRTNASYYSYSNLFIGVQNVLHTYFGLICFNIYPSQKEGEIPCPFSEEFLPLPAIPINFPPE